MTTEQINSKEYAGYIRNILLQENFFQVLGIAPRDLPNKYFLNAVNNRIFCFNP
jgi:hypothetical protein